MTSRLWEAARKTLQAVELSRAGTPPVLAVTVFVNDLDPRGALLRSDSEVTRGRIARPFESLPPAVLHRDGYVVDRRDGRWYNGPDVDLLLADEFLEDHCFGVDTAGFVNGRLGLTFAPVARRRLPEIEGTLFLTRATGELTDIEFRFVGVAMPDGARRPGVPAPDPAG